MKKFNVEVIATYSKWVEIDANDRDEAEFVAQKKLDNYDIDFEYDGCISDRSETEIFNVMEVSDET